MRKLTTILATIILTVSLPFTAMAHSGRTDANGGHRDNKNVSGLGYYHYHCGGHPAHLHENGVCPYDTPVFIEPEPEYSIPDPASTTNIESETNYFTKTAFEYHKQYLDVYNFFVANGITDEYVNVYPLYEQRVQLISQLSLLPEDQQISQINFISKIQFYLLWNKYYSGDLNGLYDAPTMNAMISFQAVNGLPQTGLPDAQTLALLGV